jgi:endonuclease YncB( thermonuclease family)
MYTYKIREYRVIDGDTIELTLDLGFKLHYIISARLANIDAPEKDTEAGRLVKQRVQDLLDNTNKLTCKVLKADKYGGRWVCEVYINNTSISTVLLSENMVKPFTGKVKKEVWTMEDLKLVEDILNK